MEQINEFGELIEDIDENFGQLELGPGLVDLAADIEDLVETYPDAEAGDEASAFADFFRSYGEEMEAAIGDPTEYVAVMTQMMEDPDVGELREDFLTACGGTLVD